MKPSPIGSKLLSGYAILFAGIAPMALVAFALVSRIDLFLPSAIGNIALGVGVVYFGGRVFVGDYSATKIFAVLVAVHYFGLTATNLWNVNEYPTDSRAAQMAVPRMIRGLLFASLYVWYYLIRRRTTDGFSRESGEGHSPAAW